MDDPAANVKRLKFTDHPEVKRFKVVDSVGWEKFPVLPRVYAREIIDPTTSDRNIENLRSYAAARCKAIQLANGVGLLSDDKEDAECWEGAAVHTNESRLLPVGWTKDSARCLTLGVM